MEMINLTIDHKPVVVSKGTTILKAASSIGIDIPTLCYMKLDDMNIENKPGGCRVCVVEVKGRRNLAPGLLHRSHRRNGNKYAFDTGYQCASNDCRINFI